MLRAAGRSGGRGAVEEACRWRFWPEFRSSISSREPSDGPTIEPARAVGRGPSRGARLPPFSVITLAIVAAAFWGAAWRNERLRLEAQRARPERFAQEPPTRSGPTRIDAR